MSSRSAGGDRSRQLIDASRELAKAADALEFRDPACFVYNPLVYARRPYELYLSRYGAGRKRVVFLGMNPGPWGMAQTGVPFGEVSSVRDWLRIEEPVGRPEREHPQRPVLGFAVPRSEASGLRLWGLMKRRFITPERFFSEHFVANYCPLLFLDGQGRNLTPDRLHRSDRDKLFEVCDAHLRRIATILEPEWLVGVGRFTEHRIRAILVRDRGAGGGSDAQLGTGDAPRPAGILHPSPASPAANRGWAEAATAGLRELGIW